MNYFLYSFVTSMLILLQTSGIGGHGGIGGLGGIGGGTTVATCGTEPAWDYEFLATTITPGTLGPGSTIVDSSGNSHLATIAVGAPVAGTTIHTPNGTQTLSMVADTYATLAGTAIANATSVTICGTYVLDSVDDSKKTVTASSAASGAYGYYPTGNGFAAQGMDATSAFNIGNGTATPPVSPTWQSTCVSYAASSPPVFYRSNGSGVMVVDTTANGSNSASFNGIDIIFANFNGGISEGFNGAIVKLVIKATTITGTQATTYACIANSAYGVG
jgi:hypothetical protein